VLGLARAECLALLPPAAVLMGERGGRFGEAEEEAEAAASAEARGRFSGDEGGLRGERWLCASRGGEARSLVVGHDEFDWVLRCLREDLENNFGRTICEVWFVGAPPPPCGGGAAAAVVW
jgi:hypothetical protein